MLDFICTGILNDSVALAPLPPLQNPQSQNRSGVSDCQYQYITMLPEATALALKLRLCVQSVEVI